MDFFTSQDVARRNTFRLVLLFVLAVISLVAVTNLLVIVLFGVLAEDPSAPVLEQFPWELVIWISVGVISLVAFGSAYKISSLAGGGARVAEMMQAKLVVDGTGDLAKQRVLNVVEEMAIASGTPVPPVYLMEEDAINAFAAGYSPSDAVIGVTRGAIDKLSREELQGVIAHEFSHILNGDMRLNIRLIGILHGIMMLGLMGYFLLRSSAMGRRSRDANKIVFLALGLIIIGFAGTFFGNLIKSAVSRQREYLADASAVQYTRNPVGIAGALKRIGQDSAGSVLNNPGASEISHALFSKGVKGSMSSLFATHPPLKDRIKRIDPQWDGSFESVSAPRIDVQDEREFKAAEAKTPREKLNALLLSGIGAAVLSQEGLQQAGNPQTAHIAYARQLHSQLPGTLLQAAHEAHGARALIYVMVLDSAAQQHQAQLSYLQEHADAGVYDETVRLLSHLVEIEAQFRLPLINIALGTLRQLSPHQYQLFRKNLLHVLSLEQHPRVQQWVVEKIVLHNLDKIFPGSGEKSARRMRLEQLGDACSELLSWLVVSGAQQDISPEQAFEAGAKELQVPGLTFRPQGELRLNRLDEAAEQLAGLRPLEKRQLLTACAASIAADGKAAEMEIELFRAVAEVIDCPVPPLLADH